MGHHFLVESQHTPSDCKVDEHPKKKVWISNFSQKLFLERFNSCTNLFSPGADLDEYGRLILKLKALPELPLYEQKAIMAYTLLFHRKDSDGSLITDDLFNNYIRSCDDCLNLRSLINILTAMVQFCDDNIDWNERSPNLESHFPPNLFPLNKNVESIPWISKF
jgi:hypothetical protein